MFLPFDTLWPAIFLRPKKYFACFLPGSNRRPCACEAHVITTTLRKLCVGIEPKKFDGHWISTLNPKDFSSHLGIEPRTFGLEVQRAILCANGTPHDNNTFLPNMIHRKIILVKCSAISFCFSTQYSFSKKLKKGKKDSARAGARTLDR